jgi:hypothetical protein
MDQIEKQSLDYATFLPKPEDIAMRIGKRYDCTVCQAELLCAKAGRGIITCHGQEVKAQEAKPIPGSD